MKYLLNAFRPTLLAIAVSGLVVGSMAMTTGCDTKEEILDVETPGGEVEVNRDKTNGNVEVDVTKDE